MSQSSRQHDLQGALEPAKIIERTLRVFPICIICFYTLTTSSPSITEGDSGTKNLTYTVTLDAAPLAAVTVNYVTSSSGTADGDDFDAVAGALTFAIGQTSATVSVTVSGDTSFESDETVDITFSGAKLVASVTATGTIVNNDVDPEIALTAAADAAETVAAAADTAAAAAAATAATAAAAATDAVAARAAADAVETAAATKAALTDAVALKVISDAAATAAAAAVTAETAAEAALTTANANLVTATAAGDSTAILSALAAQLIAAANVTTASAAITTTAATAATTLAATTAATADDAAAAAAVTAAAAADTAANTATAAATAAATLATTAATTAATAAATFATAADATASTDDDVTAATAVEAAATTTAAVAATTTIATTAQTANTALVAAEAAAAEAAAAAVIEAANVVIATAALATYNTAATTAATSLAAATAAATAADTAATNATTLALANTYVTAAALATTTAATAKTDATAQVAAAAALVTATANTTVTTDNAAAAAATTAAATANTAASAAVTAAAADVTAAAAAVVTYTPVEFTLTTAVNTFTGGSGDDTFTADETDGSVMLSTADKLDGGVGNDILDVFTDGTVFALGQLTSIETLNVYDLDADHTIDANNFASVTTVNLERGDGDLALTVGANVATIGLTDMLVADDMDLILDADATAITLNVADLTGLTGDDVIFTAAALDSVTANALTDSTFGALNVAAASTVTINATGDLTLVDGVTTTDADATITISGAGAVDISALDTDVLTVNASTNTGGITLEIGAADDTVIVGSSGNDVITASTDGTVVAADALSVNAGAGTEDVLIITATTHVSTAIEGADYTNFEIIRTAVDQDVSLVSGITAVQVLTNTGITISGLESQAITVLDDVTTDLTLTLDDATGTADAVTINLASTTAANNVDVTGITVIGVETLNINATTGTAGTDSDVTFFDADTDDLTSINLTGTADMTLSTINLDAVVTIDATDLTGDLTVTGALTAGSAVNFGAGDDITTVSATLGTTYSMGAGDDTVTAAFATLVSDGTDDTVIDGEDGDDQLVISDAAATLTDNHFTFVSNMEEFETSGTGVTSVTTGAGFNAAFADGVTITTGALAADAGYTLSAGLATIAMNVTVSGDLIVGDDAAESIAVTTGSGADTVVVNAAAFVSDATVDGSIVISTGAGNDDITLTVGTLANSADEAPVVITAGTGKDLVDVTKINGTAAAALFSGATFVINAGHSNVTTYDEITGFDIATAALVSDTLDFTDTSAVGTLATSTNFGTILSHSITDGVAEFDDAATYTTALVIDADNLADVLGYLAANTATLDTVAFEFDEDGDGTADATMVYNNNTTDSLVLLVGVTGVVSLDATNASTLGLLDLA